MSLPLSYDDGVNLRPKICDEDEAFYACDVPRKMIALKQHRLYFH